MPNVTTATRQGTGKLKCKKSKKTNPGAKKPYDPQHQSCNWQEGRKKTDEVGVSEGEPNFNEVTIQASLVDHKRPEDLKEIAPADISIDAITEVFENVEMPIASKKRASLWFKVDTGAGGNMMPLWAFGKCFPNWLTKAGLHTGLQKCKTKLRAYKGTNIP